jgi:mono/diheme cytochrome c family protein
MISAKSNICKAFCAAALLALVAVPSHGAEAPGGIFEVTGGEAIYKNVCQECHMADAQGARGAGFYPALAGNAHLATARYVITMVLKGRNGMPPLNRNMTDQQVADVVNYVRSHFGNHYGDEVRPADVTPLR